MNYLRATALYEHFFPQYFAYGRPFGISAPHQVQQRYFGLIFGFLDFMAINFMTMIITNATRRAGITTPISFIRKQFRTFSFVSILNHPIRPLAILTTIIAIVVNTVNRGVLFAKLFCMSLIRFIHIISKIFKGFPLTFYSSASIVGVRFMRRIIATLMYVRPNKIKSLFGQSVRGSRFFRLFISPATAGLGVSTFNMMTPHNYGFSAITNTLPKGMTLFSYMRKLKNLQPIELTTRYIKYFHTSSLARTGQVVNTDWGKFLKNKFGGKVVTDPQGNTWMEIDLTKEMGKLPVEAFGVMPFIGTSPRSDRTEQ